MKIRGTAAHIAEKYTAHARDSIVSSDPVAAENYFQHAEHYNRIIQDAKQASENSNAGTSAHRSRADNSVDGNRNDAPDLAGLHDNGEKEKTGSDPRRETRERRTQAGGGNNSGRSRSDGNRTKSGDRQRRPARTGRDQGNAPTRSKNTQSRRRSPSKSSAESEQNGEKSPNGVTA